MGKIKKLEKKFDEALLYSNGLIDAAITFGVADDRIYQKCLESSNAVRDI